MPIQIPGRFERRRRSVWAPQTMAMADAPMVVAFAIVVFAIAACSDSTAPRSKPLAVAVIVDQVPGPVTSVGADGLPLITCDASLRATATGTGQASWSGATIRWFAGVDDAPAFDSAVVSSSEVQTAWGSPEIAGGQSQESRWTFSAGFPFRAVFESHYQVKGGDEKAVSVTIACGPDVPVGTPPPSVTALAIHTGAGDLEPGDTLSVNYTASSAVGLWQTTVALTGPCELHQLFLDSLRTSVTRTVQFEIPAECKLGLPITVTVLLKGAGLQTGSQTLSTGIALVDKTPPRVLSVAFASPAGPPETELRTDYFAGDSIPVIVTAVDNHAVHTLVWELQPVGMRDSLIVDKDTASTVSIALPRIPLARTLTGAIQLRVYARDAAGLTSDTAISPKIGTSLVHPTIDRPTASATVPGQVQDMVLDSRRGVAYLLQPSQQRVAVLSLSTLTVTAVATLPSAPSHMDLSASGDTLVVLLPQQGSLGIIDVRQASLQTSLVPLTAFDTTLDQRLAQMGIAANGKVFVAAQGPAPGYFRLLEADLATGVQRVRTDAGTDGVLGDAFVFLNGGGIARSPDGSVLALVGAPRYLQRYDVSADSFGPASTTAASYVQSVSLDATGQRTAVGVGIYDASLQFLRNVRTPYGVLPPTVISPAGDILYEGVSFEGLVRASVDDGALLDRTPSPIVPALVRISDDGALLVMVGATSGTTTRIATIDLR